MAHLTPAERDTLNAAMDIILAHTPEGASWMIDARHYLNSDPSYGLTYFTATKAQHGWLPGDTLADKIEAAIAIQAEEYANADTIVVARIAALRKELATLTATLTGETA